MGKVRGLGKPPVIESTPGGLPARIVASSLPPATCVLRAKTCLKSVTLYAELQRARLAAVERGHVLIVVREVVERLAAGLRREDRALAAADPFRRLERCRDPLLRRDQKPVVVAEDDVARRHLHAAHCDRRPGGRSRDRRAGARRGAAREHGQADLTQPAQVAAEAVGDDPGKPAPARLGREQLAEHGARAPAGRDHEHVPGRRLREPGHHRQVVVLGEDREGGPGHADVRDHRPQRGLGHRQRLVGVRERRDVDLQQPLDQVHGRERATPPPRPPYPRRLASSRSGTASGAIRQGAVCSTARLVPRHGSSRQEESPGMSSTAARRVLVALLVCACSWLAVTGTAAAQVGRGIDPNQGLRLVEVNLPSKVAAMRLQVRAHRYKVEFNEHYLRRNSNGTVTATVFGTKRGIARLNRAGYDVGATIEGPATWRDRIADYKAARRAERRADAAARGKSLGTASHTDEIVILRVDYFENYAGRFLSVEAKDRLGGSTPTGATYTGPALSLSWDTGPGTPISTPPRPMSVNIDPDTTPDTYIEHRLLVRIGDVGHDAPAAADAHPRRLEHRRDRRGRREHLGRRRCRRSATRSRTSRPATWTRPRSTRASSSSRASSRTSPSWYAAVQDERLPAPRAGDDGRHDGPGRRDRGGELEGTAVVLTSRAGATRAATRSRPSSAPRARRTRRSRSRPAGRPSPSTWPRTPRARRPARPRRS